MNAIAAATLAAVANTVVKYNCESRNRISFQQTDIISKQLACNASGNLCT